MPLNASNSNNNNIKLSNFGVGVMTRGHDPDPKVVGEAALRGVVVGCLLWLVGCAAPAPEYPDYPEGSARARLWQNLGPPHAVATTPEGVEGWLYKRVQLDNTCHTFTAWLDGEAVFLIEPIETRPKRSDCFREEAVDVSRYSDDAPRSELIVLDKAELEIIY